MYVIYSRPYKHSVYNILITINEIALSLIAFIQVIFYTNNKTKNIILTTGWIMISLCIINILINFVVWIFYNIRSRIRKWKSSPQNNIQNDNIISRNSKNPNVYIHPNDITSNNSRLLFNNSLISSNQNKLNSSNVSSKPTSKIQKKVIFVPGNFSLVTESKTKP